MKSNELRIGNLVYDRGNKILRIDYWERKDMIAQKVVVGRFVGHPLTEDVEFLKPIPLTKEWLLKFGFEKKENSLFSKKLEYIYNSLKYCDDYKFWIYYNDDNDAACNSIADLKYVHELQNLYFALTKEELTM